MLTKRRLDILTDFLQGEENLGIPFLLRKLPFKWACRANLARLYFPIPLARVARVLAVCVCSESTCSTRSGGRQRSSLLNPNANKVPLHDPNEAASFSPVILNRLSPNGLTSELFIKAVIDVWVFLEVE